MIPTAFRRPVSFHFFLQIPHGRVKAGMVAPPLILAAGEDARINNNGNGDVCVTRPPCCAHTTTPSGVREEQFKTLATATGGIE